MQSNTQYLLCHPQASDLAWGPKGWCRLRDATVFSEAGKNMFKVRRNVEGRWANYPAVLTTPLDRVLIDLSKAADPNCNVLIDRGVLRFQNKVAREQRARMLREHNPLPKGVTNGQG